MRISKKKMKTRYNLLSSLHNNGKKWTWKHIKYTKREAIEFPGGKY
jgi:hypothetical protein